MNNKLISVIIVNYNGAEFIEECINSVISQTYTNWEIIVLDNHSTDHSVEVIRQFPCINLIEANVNHGFAKGNNIAIRKAQGEYIALLNNDAVADPAWLELMVEFLDTNDEYGSCACKIISYYDHEVMDSAGLLIHASGMSRGRGRNEHISKYNVNEEILLPSGCASLFRKKALDEVGLFDEDFFCYCEDTDLGFRLQLAAWKCMYICEAIVHHRYSATAGKYSLFKTYLVERNHFWFVIKNFPLSLILVNPVYTASLYAHQVINVFAKKGAAKELMNDASTSKLALTLVKAHKDVWKAVVVMLKKRNDINKTKSVSQKEIKAWFKRNHITIRELFNS